MAPVAIVTDSTAYLPQDLVEQYGITVVPNLVVWDGETYRDGVDMTPQQFYERLRNAKTLPTTSQAAAGTYVEAYRALLDQGYDILSIHLSKDLSGTIESARQAKQMLGDVPIRIVDSRSVGMGLGFVVLAAARAVAEGADLEEATAVAEKAKDHVGVIFAVDTLEYLHRGGRIGGAQRLLGMMLNVKPILEIRDGRVEPVDKVRTRKKSLQRVLDLIEQRIAGRSPVRLATLHADAEEEARALLNEAARRFNAVEAYLTDVSPTVGVHVGPGTVGLAFMAGM
ncbi:MAG: DegV family protein [Chloroflexi bacterium]|nr:DegV family protein [Chloroflexota bacterium]